jgi:hypothetical protein
VGLGYLEGETAEAAAGAQDFAAGPRPLGKDADADSRPQRLDRPRQRLLIPLAPFDRDLAHAVEDRTEAADLPEIGFRQRPDLPPLQRRDTDHHRVPVAVVVADDQQRPTLGQSLQTLDLQPAPPGDGLVDVHRQAVGAGALEHRTRICTG